MLMVDLSVVRDLVTIFGVIAGFSYYVITVRNAQTARKYQTLQQMSNDYTTGESYKVFMDLMSASWTDLDEYNLKYSSRANPEFSTSRLRLFQSINVYGMMMREGLIDSKMMYDAAGRGFIDLWEKFSDVIMADRESLYNGDTSYLGAFEYMYKELVKERTSRGASW